MTTATRPLPDHGTYARANGSPGLPMRHLRPRKARRAQAHGSQQAARQARLD
jgi:hypothetical protein